MAIGHEGRVVHAAGFGTAELDSGALIDPDTSFDIGSSSKQFTGLAVLLAARDGDLDLDREIRGWVPELPLHRGFPATLRHLLHHTGGLPDYISLLLDAGFTYGDPTTAQDALDALASAGRPEFEPRTDWAYSNTGYFLLGVALERATGTSLPASGPAPEANASAHGPSWSWFHHRRPATWECAEGPMPHQC